MSDHHWYDDDGHHDDPQHHEEVLPVDDLSHEDVDEEWLPEDHDLPPAEELHHEDDIDVPVEEPAPAAVVAEDVIGADPDAVPEETGGEDVFPPLVDVGELPEPVDGFPWIDTGSLGTVPAAEVTADAGAPDAAELAGYAAADLPPGQDPWAALEASDDPATAALARFYSPGRTSPDS